MAFGFWALFKFDPIITLGNVVQSLTTLFVGLIVATYLQRHTHAERREKEMLLEHLGALLISLLELEKYKEGGAITDIAGALKKFSMTSQAICSILGHLSYPKEISDYLVSEEEMKELRRLATETPIKQIEDLANKAKCSAKVRDGIIELASERKRALDIKIQDIKIRIFKAQLRVNRI